MNFFTNYKPHILHYVCIKPVNFQITSSTVPATKQAGSRGKASHLCWVRN